MNQARILIVEDESIVALDIQHVLKKLGYQVVAAAAAGQAAIDKTEETRPDLVLMDIRLKGDMDGVEAAQRIRARFDIPVVYLTAHADQATLERAKGAEPFGYLVKPFEEQDLHTTIEIALDRHTMNRKLKESERWLATTLNSIGDAVIATDAQGGIKFMNPVAEALSGWHQKEALGRNLGDVFRTLDEQSRSQAQSLIGQVLGGHPTTGVVNHTLLLSKDGAQIPIDHSATPIIDDAGTISGAVLVFRDITARKRLEEQYHQAQKMETVGLLAGGIAHEFNNLLTAINGYAELVQLHLSTDDPLAQWVAKIRDSGRRAADLVSQLLAFSRKQIIEPKVLNLNAQISDLSWMLGRLVGEHIKLNITLEPGLWPVKVDPNQIEQVIVNLAVNARDAMPGGGKLTIETDNVALDEAYVAGHLEAKVGEYVRLTVSDSGVGMSEEEKSHIFEPFFTTKEVGKGTGLGLATIYGIVHQSGGHIWVDSQKGVGSTFEIYLPRAEGSPQPMSHADVERTLPMGDETILLVEDEAEVRYLVQVVLRRQGYTILEAGGGEEALRVAANHNGPISLLLTDIVMPGVNGVALAEQLTQVYPGLKTLFMSGYTNEPIAHYAAHDPSAPFLQKPFSPADLARKVREVLDV